MAFQVLSQRYRRSRRGTVGAVFLALAALSCLWQSLTASADASAPATAMVLGTFAKQTLPPAAALLVGLGMLLGGGNDTVATMFIYFGAQTGMNLYMKIVLSSAVVDEEENLKGIPIGFLLTGIQQLVAFCVFCLFVLLGKVFGNAYQIKKLETQKDYLAVLLFSIAFAANIGLNNVGMSLVPISVNMIIRSCLPLSTAVAQYLIDPLLGRRGKSFPAMDWLLMCLGVGCAGAATLIKTSGSTGGEADSIGIGVMVLVASLFSGALNMVLAGVLGSELKLNPLDSTCYMALPAALVMLVPGLTVPHPMGNWPGFPAMTDWQVLCEVLARRPAILWLVLFSGVLAFVYNILQYSLVHKLSASHAAFCGNFNKAATVALSLLLGLESLPAGNMGLAFLAAVGCNILAFTVFSMRKAGKK